MKRLLPPLALAGAAAAANNHANVAATTSRELVFGSSPTVPGRHPYMAALLSGSRQFCAGVLVAPDTVLSAAHCADDNNRITSVRVGHYSRINLNDQDETDDQNETELGEEFEVKRIIRHPYHRSGFDYINDHLLHDIVLIKSLISWRLGHEEGSTCLQGGGVRMAKEKDTHLQIWSE